MLKLSPLSEINKKEEIVGGITTFLTMSYILVVNPAILSTDGTGMHFSGALFATIIISFLATLLMGLFANLPFALAPGMGLNAFFAFTVVLGAQVPWPTALGMVFWSGVIFLIISLTNLREKIVTDVPRSLQAAASVGIGIFLTFIGLKNSGLVVDDPATLVKFGELNAQSLLSILGLFIISFFMRTHKAIAFLLGIGVITIISLILGFSTVPAKLTQIPDIHSHLFKLDIWGALKLSFIPIIITMTITDLFDSMATFVGVSKNAGLVDKKGNPKNLKPALFIDSIGTLLSGLLGTSATTTYIESASGISSGAKTGWASIVTALCFLPFLFIGPFFTMIPGFATGPVLIYVGFLMFKSVRDINIEDTVEVIPAFITIILIPLSFSITKGILAGFVSYIILAIFNKRKLNPIMWILGLLSVLLFYFEN